MNYRNTSQFLMPAEKPLTEAGKYDIYPSFDIGPGRISRGVDSLSLALSDNSPILIDGYTGAFLEPFLKEIATISECRRFREYIWVDTSDFMIPETEINRIVEPFLGGDDPLFGRRSDLTLSDFFDLDKIAGFMSDPKEKSYIIIGTGASLFSDTGTLVYIDLPKNELQYRSRAGSVNNLGMKNPEEPKIMYKRFYFVDWIVLNRHKQLITGRIDIIADGQRPEDITWMHGEDWRNAINEMSISAFRARPWFEPGAWGGDWIKKHIQGLNTSVSNYAWSFELIAPENGLILISSGIMLEFSFDFLMYQRAQSVLGDCYKRFGYDFPIRFDYLDTFNGGNLSVQCHPSEEFMTENFGESFTQDETYYIAETSNDSGVWLGIREDVDPETFFEVLCKSSDGGKPVRIEDFIHFHPATKNDLFIIPAGTVHGAGVGNLVLEISSTPYIFTFKMYDWQRPDLDGKPRTLNIDRARANLIHTRNGEYARKNLLSYPILLEEGEDWKLCHLPLHESMFYTVYRYNFKSTLSVSTDNRCLVLNLVEGHSADIITENNRSFRINLHETFIIPASAIGFKAINRSTIPATLVMAFVK